MNTKRKISFIYKLVLVLLLITGILSRAGLLGGKLQLHTFYSFTTISNIYILIITILTLVCIYNSKESPYKARIIGLIMILITGLIYHFILLPEKMDTIPNYNVFTYGNVVSHYIAPCMMFIDWLIFDEKGMIKKRDYFFSITIPIFYFIITSLYGYISALISGKDAKYVYFFVDFNELGVIGVLSWCFFILLAYSTLVFILWFLDNIISNYSNEKY